MNFSFSFFYFSFFPSSYLGLLLLGFLVFMISFFFEKSLIVFCLDRFSIVVVVFGSSFCFRFGRLDFYFDVSL